MLHRRALQPQAVGQRAASLDIPVSGVGVLSVGLFGEGTRGAVLYGPDSMLFADQTVATTSSVQTVMIRNIGTSDMWLFGTALQGSNPGDFAVTQASTNPCVKGAPLKGDAGGMSCSISSIASGSAYTVKLAVTTLSGNRTVITNTAWVTGGSVDPVRENNTATATTTIVGRK